MKYSTFLREFSSQEYRRFILPFALGSLGVLIIFEINLLIDREISVLTRDLLTLLLAGAAMYITTFSFYLIPLRRNRDLLTWLNAILSGIGLSVLAQFTPPYLSPYLDLLLIMAVLSTSIFSGILPTASLIALAIIPSIFRQISSLDTLLEWVGQLGIPIVSIIISQVIIRVWNISRSQVRRLEIINEFSRTVASSLDREQILSRLGQAIPKALTFDSYYISVVEDGKARALLCYDEGEYFTDIVVPAAGTLTNWVVQNQTELFLPDLRQPIELEGVETVIVGKDKASLSWIGVPMTSSAFKGVLALASYQPNAFNRSDVELLSNLAQHAALAFDNAAHHAEVEERARLDSLTGVFNHGYFLSVLQGQVEDARLKTGPLGLIMLDVDYFKEYNDNYGHQIGDQILVQLCEIIRRHIHASDAVGRWGGEEFVISLPGANSTHAQGIAERIRLSMCSLKIAGRNGDKIPAPTVSQGIAILARETDDIYELIDLADQRLYQAKHRGRDQIEPAPAD